MLAKGNDPVLQSLAALELDKPTGSNDRLHVADGWWNYSETLPPALRPVIRLHAGMWYAQVSASLTGLSKLKAEQRAADYLKSVAPLTAVADTGGADNEPSFDGPLAILQSLPPNLFPATIVGWDEQHRKAVNDALSSTVVGHLGNFTITVGESGPALPFHPIFHSQQCDSAWPVPRCRRYVV